MGPVPSVHWASVAHILPVDIHALSPISTFLLSFFLMSSCTREHCGVKPPGLKSPLSHYHAVLR